MGTSEPPRTAPKPATGLRKSSGPAGATTNAGKGATRATGVTPPSTPKPNAVAEGLSDAARQLIKSSVLGKAPYLKMAFANPYNLSLFGGLLAASALTLNPILALAAFGLEGLWLLHAPDSERLKHVLWDPRFSKLKRALEEQERAERLTGVGVAERERVERLVLRQQEIRDLAARNPSFTGELLRNELVKTDRLVDSFIEMAVTCGRYQDYLASVDLDQLEHERRRFESEVRSGSTGDPATEVARKNLAILLKRLEKMKEIQRYLTLAQGQLDLIENSFQLIADQIVTMQSPQELSGQLDELLDGVQAIRETSRETESFLSTLRLTE